jgi:hypothetical protein
MFVHRETGGAVFGPPTSSLIWRAGEMRDSRFGLLYDSMTRNDRRAITPFASFNYFLIQSHVLRETAPYTEF